MILQYWLVTLHSRQKTVFLLAAFACFSHLRNKTRARTPTDTPTAIPTFDPVERLSVLELVVLVLLGFGGRCVIIPANVVVFEARLVAKRYSGTKISALT